MSYRMAVCVKQVPDTENLSGEVMKEDGTVNRSALPSIVNPEDLNALEMAIQIREQEGGEVIALSMGPPSAAEALRECLYRGADRAVLLTDRKFAASDTLATSYILSCAVRSLGDLDLVMCGRQAIDGDTAQIGPQLAEKLALPQVTYVQEVQELEPGRIVLRRSFDEGYEVVEAPLPLLLTVTDEANEPRRPSAKRLMKYKKARTPYELEKEEREDFMDEYREKGLLIGQWSHEDAGCDLEQCGGSGSPTKVKNIESVKLVSEEHEQIDPTPDGVSQLVQHLGEEHLFE